MIKEFRVKGGITPFPLDMLRYDECWPATQDDATTIYQQITGDIPLGHIIEVLLHKKTTRKELVNYEARWASFGWPVIAKRFI